MVGGHPGPELLAVLRHLLERRRRHRFAPPVGRIVRLVDHVVTDDSAILDELAQVDTLEPLQPGLPLLEAEVPVLAVVLGAAGERDHHTSAPRANRLELAHDAARREVLVSTVVGPAERRHQLGECADGNATAGRGGKQGIIERHQLLAGLDAVRRLQGSIGLALEHLTGVARREGEETGRRAHTRPGAREMEAEVRRSRAGRPSLEASRGEAAVRAKTCTTGRGSGAAGLIPVHTSCLGM